MPLLGNTSVVDGVVRSGLCGEEVRHIKGWVSHRGEAHCGPLAVVSEAQDGRNKLVDSANQAVFVTEDIKYSFDVSVLCLEKCCCFTLSAPVHGKNEGILDR